MAPGASAYVLPDKFRCDFRALRESTTVQVWLKNGFSRGAVVAIPNRSFAICKPGGGGVVNVSPIEPTLRAALV